MKDTFDKEKMTIENYLKPTKIEQLMELTIPYFRDIKLDKLIKVLQDEEDSLSPFRKELKRRDDRYLSAWNCSQIYKKLFIVITITQ